MMGCEIRVRIVQHTSYEGETRRCPIGVYAFKQIADKSQQVKSVVVVAQAGFNAFRGEPTRIFLSPYENLLLYQKGAVVATQLIDGTQTEVQILSALEGFLANKVRATFLKRGLIPQTDPVTGAPMVGVIDQVTSLAIVKQVQQAGAQAQVRASVTEDTYSSGPLPLPLSVDVSIPPRPVSFGNRRSDSGRTASQRRRSAQSPSDSSSSRSPAPLFTGPILLRSSARCVTRKSRASRSRSAIAAPRASDSRTPVDTMNRSIV